MIPKLLSKTKILRGYRCDKCLYLTVHQPRLEAPITPDTQALFDQGNVVGAKAREYFPGGVLVDNVPWDFGGALAKTRALIAAGATIIYEAAFEYLGCYARADIIVYSPESQKWRVYEVKSTTKVKPEHLDDIGLQTWIMAKSGLPLEQINMMHLNTACRYPDLSNLFTTQDVTEEMRANYLSVQPKIAALINMLRRQTVPDINIGAHCVEPNECGFKAHCWEEKNIPSLSVFNLPNIRARKWELYEAGILLLDDPRLTELTDIQQRVVDVYKSGESYINRAAIKEAISSWQFPLVFLDFETINPAIPRYNGLGPYQQMPFQFSVHTLTAREAPLTHEAFLHDNASDPRPTLLPALLKACGEAGSIVAYFGKFEAERIEELKAFAPAHTEALQKLIDRIVDPLPIFREHVYENAFQGSFSLKKVAPAILGETHSYDAMDVANGGDAQRAFEKLISEHTPLAEKEKLRQAMLDYCEKDTFVMVELVKWLYQQ